PNGRISKKTSLSANQRLTFDIKDSKFVQNKNISTKVWFKKKKNPIEFSHSIKNILDFDRQKLLHFQPSFSGPPMIKGDFNQDGKEDIVLGGGKDQPTQIWIQDQQGGFTLKKNSVFDLDKSAVDTSISAIDVDRDGDLDLMVAHGGYHQLNPKANELSDRLYINNGTGTFSKSDIHFNREASSTTAVHDFNSDGYPDLFVGGGIVPGRYPEHYPNKLWINNQKGGFEFDTIQSSLINDHEGIVRDALWEDLNQDGLKDLILVGEWMPVTVFIASKEGLIKKPNFFVDLKLKEGWWNRICSTDLNKDGKPDFILGNEGLNNSFKASAKTPVELYFGDYDQNGSVDPIFSYYIGNKSYPLATRDELLSQMVSLKSNYPSYQSFSEATTASLLSNFSDLGIQKWKAITHESVILLSQETGYSIQLLPQIVQQSPLTAILPFDINQDGNQDLLLAGNRNKMALKIGQQDANFGMILMGDGSGNFHPVNPRETGLKLIGDISEILAIGSDFYFGRCNQDLLTFQIKNNE
ncbi:MAG: VCBS repeat-containing protein, partial [Flavobacteriaceae bacterium]